MELGLSLSGTSNATLISATETPEPSAVALLRMEGLLKESLAFLPMLSMLDKTKFATYKNPTKKKILLNGFGLATTTPEGLA
eukprot:CAMPEP_0172566492 /NCGR_PEP_ID=MMETSP1067-20121228/112027_1 /TAXON_ID=265564 ORGANISM="Thalassiosira punctigera, Strain Tpunct2005C2" /NCGR_SAMPLE_ID=MMETSP1067 /ASSEMBLY_ACC=CAM_ASM_000444 /LENGTH=81 /DNA_ID=CAMNT_0013357619 /DNA_START=323 /DNA_END=571 /DNA_ORIENTATION=-